MWDAITPYNGLPDLPPREELETRRVLKATIEARASLATLNKAAQLIPNPSVLINTLPLLEAQASSEIENIVTTADELFRFSDSDEFANPAVKETLRYRTALNFGVDSVRGRPLNVSTAVDVCSLIQGRQMSVRQLPGTKVANSATLEVIYTPPEGESLIREKLGNWEEFIHSAPSLDPLVKMAVAHYQFEAIHPFDDGNGRTGRILNLLMLVEAGLLNEPILYMSRSIIATKAEYYRLLQAVTATASWENWSEYMLNMVRITADETIVKIDAIRELQDEFHTRVKAEIPIANNADFLAVLFEQPYCRIRNVIDRCSVSRPTAATWLKHLAERGLLVEVKSGREKLFINSRFLELLTRQGPVVTAHREPVLF
ncbi:MAG TPA: Fic family protein [Pseudolysinimonas sp.]|nr:Fic family protein [Pseudolysinimonas sp.]